jgi:hypothetical protein
MPDNAQNRKVNRAFLSSFLSRKVRGCQDLSEGVLCQKQTWQRIFLMSALRPKADIRQGNRDVRFVPKADIPMHSFQISSTSGSYIVASSILHRTFW